MTPRFIDAVQTKKLVRVRFSLSNELMLDPRGKTFTEMLQYAESNLPLLYLDDDGKIYDEDSSKWNEDFLYDLKNDLDLNFSKEKLSLYEIVAKHECAATRRGMGFMQGIVIQGRPVGEVVKAALAKGLLVISAGSDVLRIVPPLVITKEHIDKMAVILDECME